MALRNIATLAFFMMMAFSGAYSSSVYRVGDSDGWTSRGLVDYNEWASTKDFHVGDTLIFAYTINSTMPSQYYFLCGAPGHCQAGQKVDIKVTLPVPENLIPSPSPSSPYGYSSPSASNLEEMSPSSTLSSGSTLNSSKLGFAVIAFVLSLLGFVF
ncbi:blue copper protein-like [Prunus avium]|uniref:Blue copper protein-like n=1 Tax=Prunus avium TaxID=42229 RepID=A0A6P5SGX1_PRUAV|nr:blue copper protein-like [Prunus avium]